MKKKQNMIGVTIRSTNEVAAANEVINQQNAEINEKILAALMSTSRSKPANAELLDKLGIKYTRYDGSTGWALTGPNGREIDYRAGTAKHNERIDGFSKAVKRKGSGHYNYSRNADDREDWAKVDLLTALTSPQASKAVRRNGGQPNQRIGDYYGDDHVWSGDKLLDLEQERKEFVDEKKRASRTSYDSTFYITLPQDGYSEHIKTGLVRIRPQEVDTIRKQLQMALVELDEKEAKSIAAAGEKGLAAKQRLQAVADRTGLTLDPTSKQRVRKAPTEAVEFRHVKRKK